MNRAGGGRTGKQAAKIQPTGDYSPAPSRRTGIVPGARCYSIGPAWPAQHMQEKVQFQWTLLHSIPQSSGNVYYFFSPFFDRLRAAGAAKIAGEMLGITAQLCLRPSPNLLPHPCSYKRGEIHTVFPPFYNFRMRQNLWPNALAKLCGAAVGFVVDILHCLPYNTDK